MVFTLISATPSPFARMNRIAMLYKGIPFELQNEIPWHENETQTPKYNPLEKLPILLDPGDPDFEPVYDSQHIQEYLIQKFAHKEPKLLTGDMDLDLKARQLQTLSEGIMDAFVLEFFEAARPEEKRSPVWVGRQARKIDNSFKHLDGLCKKKPGEYLIGDGKTLTIADIAVVCSISLVEFWNTRPTWHDDYPSLYAWYTAMEEKEHFKDTKLVMFDIKADTVV